MSELSFANNVVILNYEECGIKFLKFDPYKWDTSVQYTHLDWLLLYKKYCDSSYKIPFFDKIRLETSFSKNYEHILKHYHRLKYKHKTRNIVGECISILFYSVKLCIKYVCYYIKYKFIM